jgi:hypothetical protein
MNNGVSTSLTCWITQSPRHLYLLSHTLSLSFLGKERGTGREGGSDGENGGNEVVG